MQGLMHTLPKSRTVMPEVEPAVASLQHSLWSQATSSRRVPSRNAMLAIGPLILSSQARLLLPSQENTGCGA